MKVLFLDDSFAYDSYTPRHDPMSGPEKGLVYLAEALARRGRTVVVRNNCAAPRDLRGVAWRPLGDDDGTTEAADLVVALRDPRLLDRAPPSGVRALWLATSGALLSRGETAEALGRHADAKLVFMGERHRSTWSGDDARATIVRPGVAPAYLESEGPAGFWPPRAVVTTHPRVGLNALLDLWCARIEPLMRGAELHIFSGLLARAASGRTIDGDVAPIFRKAEAAAGQGVTIRRPTPDADMAEEYRHARVHIYPFSPHEIYAATLAESQAAGCPGVTYRKGAAQERILDSRTGFLAPDDEALANCSVLCLKEDIVYRGRSRDAYGMKRDRSWDDAAVEFEALARS